MVGPRALPAVGGGVCSAVGGLLHYWSWSLCPGPRGAQPRQTRQGSDGNGDLGGARRARQENWARPGVGVQGRELRTRLRTHLGGPWKRVVSTFVILNVLTPTLTKGNE